MRRIHAHATCVGTRPAHAIRQKLGDGVQSLVWRERIGFDRLVGVDGHGRVRESARMMRASHEGSCARQRGVKHHLRERFRSWRAHRRSNRCAVTSAGSLIQWTYDTAKFNKLYQAQAARPAHGLASCICGRGYGALYAVIGEVRQPTDLGVAESHRNRKREHGSTEI